MNCPACGRGLKQLTVSDVTVDVCKGGCGGIWFDQFELKKFDEPHEAEGQELLEVDRDPGVSVDHTQRLKCPKCADMVMMRHLSASRERWKWTSAPDVPAFGLMSAN